MDDDDDNAKELSPELAEFIDQLIVPLLVELAKNGHLLRPEATGYDDVLPGRVNAAQEAA